MNPDSDVGSTKDTDEEKTIIVAVLAALIIISGLVIYVAITPPPQEHFASIYLLNSEKMAGNYPQLLMLNRNNTFLLWVGVENFMGRIEYDAVEVELANLTSSIKPVSKELVMRFEKMLINNETWEFPLVMTINQTGSYRIIFELWYYDEIEAIFVNSLRSVNLSLEVVGET